MTWIDVIDSAVKIGLGAFIAAVASYITLKKTQNFEVNQRKEAFFYKSQDERKLIYIDFSAQSHALIQKYNYEWCDATKEDYKAYLILFSNIQILCEDAIRSSTSDAFNAVTVFITFNKQNLIAGDDDVSKLHDDLRDSARLKLAIFQQVAQMDVTRVFEANKT